MRWSTAGARRDYNRAPSRHTGGTHTGIAWFRGRGFRSLPLEAARRGDDRDGRTYTIEVTVSDGVNGYSGYVPPSHVHRLTLMEPFPDLATIAKLQADGVKYVIVHSEGYSPQARSGIVHSLSVDHGLGYVGEFDDGWGGAAVFRMR